MATVAYCGAASSEVRRALAPRATLLEAQPQEPVELGVRGPNTAAAVIGGRVLVPGAIAGAKGGLIDPYPEAALQAPNAANVLATRRLRPTLAARPVAAVPRPGTIGTMPTVVVLDVGAGQAATETATPRHDRPHVCRDTAPNAGAGVRAVKAMARTPSVRRHLVVLTPVAVDPGTRHPVGEAEVGPSLLTGGPTAKRVTEVATEGATGVAYTVVGPGTGERGIAGAAKRLVPVPTVANPYTDPGPATGLLATTGPARVDEVKDHSPLWRALCD